MHYLDYEFTIMLRDFGFGRTLTSFIGDLTILLVNS